ncbi:MAG: sugar ABC transporter substrate-binding protein [Lachnospiraceae bacterium]|nr:sugar ABC transporter substrate-binding protein [Lachnospiraceae bacterium]
MKHGRIKQRMFLVAAILLVTAAGLAAAMLMNDAPAAQTGLSKKETLHLWYTDGALTDYLSSKALEFYNEKDIRVVPELVSGLEYLEAVNSASLNGEQNAPDVYVVTNDSLEKAYLSGLAAELDETAAEDMLSSYSQAAKNAVTYNGRYVGWPFYFETAALLYNKTYLEQIAQEANEALEDAAADAAVSAEALVPESIADILNFADMYSAPENVEYFFRWDVSDIFYNYFFVGNYISVGGDAGDDKNNIDIYNTESVSTLKVYQELNQFFSIDTKETNYDTIMQEFLEGKTIYTIATSDCISKLDEAAKNGEFDYEYGIARLPDINSELSTRGMSVTNALVVNGYSAHKTSALSLTKFLADASPDNLYEMTGKISAAEKESYDNAHVEGFVQNYADTVPIPKLLEASNFWVELETCFARVWSGEDANAQLKSLSEQIKTQLSGVSMTEEALEDPQVELLPAVEYEDAPDAEEARE